MVSFLNFEAVANESCIIYGKRQQVAVKLSRKIKSERKIKD